MALGIAHFYTVANACMDQFVIEYDIVPLGNAGKKTQIGIISRIKDQGTFNLMELCEIIFEFHKKFMVPCQ